jgi:2'-5' RNA ligase
MKTIKNFESWLLEKEGDSYSYGCAMLYFKNPEMEKIQSQIEEDDIYEEEGDRTFGLEDEPHVTLLYGLHSNDIEDSDVMETIKGIKIGNITLENISLFENDKYEVLKFDAQSDCLHEINKELCDNFPYTNDFPDYHPHSTIAYLKKGTGKKYVEKFSGISNTVTPDQIVYSKPDGSKVKDDL